MVTGTQLLAQAFEDNLSRFHHVGSARNPQRIVGERLRSGQVAALKDDSSRSWWDGAGEDAQERCLASAVRSDQPVNPSRLQVDAYSFNAVSRLNAWSRGQC
jgi:hypothetical protein